MTLDGFLFNILLCFVFASFLSSSFILLMFSKTGFPNFLYCLFSIAFILALIFIMFPLLIAYDLLCYFSTFSINVILSLLNNFSSFLM